MASHSSTPRSVSRSSTSSDSSDTTMLDAPPSTPAQPRRASQGNPSSTTQAPARDPSFSLLLSLPRELRDRIYTFALSSPYPFWWPVPSSPQHNLALGLLTTSKQVYNEAAQILYSNNKFLFTHPTDCNMFRVISSKYSELITSVCFRIREKDMRLWTSYLGSGNKERSLKNDLPKLKCLWIFLRCGTIGPPNLLAQLGGPAMAGVPPALAAQVQAVQNLVGQQVQAAQNLVGQHAQALQQHVQNLQGYVAHTQHTIGGGNQAAGQGQNAAAAPQHQQHQHNHPPPPQPHHHHHHGHHQQPQPPQHPHPLYTTFFRFQHEHGLEALCLSLQNKVPEGAETKIVCIMRLPRPEVARLVRLYPDELTADRSGDARTTFRRLWGVEVSLEVSGFDIGVEAN